MHLPDIYFVRYLMDNLTALHTVVHIPFAYLIPTSDYFAFLKSLDNHNLIDTEYLMLLSLNTRLSMSADNIALESSHLGRHQRTQ